MAPLYLVTGNATSGKDTFFTLLATHLSDRKLVRFALADALKRELDPLFKAFGGTAFETDPGKKALIRPVMVSHGCSRRTIQPTYWIDQIAPLVKASIAAGETPVICDGRFENECIWARSLGAKVVHIERVLPDGSVLGPVNEEEAANESYLKTNADVVIRWETRDIHQLWAYVESAAKQLELIA